VRGAALPVVAAPLRDAHVHRLEQGPARIRGVALGGAPLEAAHVPAEEPRPAAVEDPDGPEAHTGRDPDDAAAVVDGAGDPGDVGTVPVAVRPGGRVRGGAVMAADDVQLRIRADPRVYDRDVRVDAPVDPVDLGGRRPGRPA